MFKFTRVTAAAGLLALGLPAQGSTVDGVVTPADGYTNSAFDVVLDWVGGPAPTLGGNEFHFVKDPNGDIRVALVLSPGYVDNTVNPDKTKVSSGYGGDHHLEKLVSSDHLEVSVLKDGGGSLLTFKLDYLAAFDTTGNGDTDSFLSAGVVDKNETHKKFDSNTNMFFNPEVIDKADGEKVEDTSTLASLIPEVETSMAWNLKTFGGLPDFDVDDNGKPIKETKNGKIGYIDYESPAFMLDPADPTDELDPKIGANGNYIPVDPAFNGYEYRLVYEFLIDSSVFSNGMDFGGVEVVSGHASPSRGGDVLTGEIPPPPPNIIVPTPSAALAGVSLFGILGMRRKRRA